MFDISGILDEKVVYGFSFLVKFIIALIAVGIFDHFPLVNLFAKSLCNQLASCDAVSKALRVGRHHDRGQAARGPKLRQPLQGELGVGPVL